MNSQYVPRDYMDDAIKAVCDNLSRYMSTLVVQATGTGKTDLYLQVAERFLDENPNERVLVVAHREELITQPAKRWRRNREEWPAIEMGELRSDINPDNDLFDSAPLNGRVVIATAQTLNSGRRCINCTADCQHCSTTKKVAKRCKQCDGEGCSACKWRGTVKSKCPECNGYGWICIADNCDRCFEHFARRMQKFASDPFGLIIIDEAHHSIADSYARIVRYFRAKNQNVKILGLTATPDRTDEEALGQVYESVAFTYNLPQPIFDGWLTPIEQQFVMVEDLNLARCRTTAGDLNEGDLEAEMLAEAVLHKVTTPLIEIACGLEQGTIDRLVRENRVEDLLNFSKRREPVLVHAASVAHAERMAEIINRYVPDSALCIVGTTPRDRRRDGLKRFASGEHQFLLSCGVFLEGTDLPHVSIIGMARPTKSRALYSQMLGRGLRPLSGLVDGVALAEERVSLIARSAKSRCLVVDFVGNSGRHKLICSADILGDRLPDALVEKVIRKAATLGQPVDVLRALQEAQQQEKRERQQQARQAAAMRAAEEERLRQQAAERRSVIMAGAKYTSHEVDPFDVFDLAPEREPGYARGRRPTESMLAVLRKAKVPFTPENTFWEIHLLVEEVVRRRREGLCTYSQAKVLEKFGYSTDTPFAEASAIIDELKRNGWKRPGSQGKGEVA